MILEINAAQQTHTVKYLSKVFSCFFFLGGMSQTSQKIVEQGEVAARKIEFNEEMFLLLMLLLLSFF